MQHLSFSLTTRHSDHPPPWPDHPDCRDQLDHFDHRVHPDPRQQFAKFAKKYCWKLKSEEIARQKDPEKQFVKSLLGRTICRKRTWNNNLHKWLIYFKKNLEHHLVEQVVRNNDLQKSYLKQKIANIWRKTTTWENHLQKSCLERQFVKFLSI